MAAHCKRDRRRVCLCANGLRKPGSLIASAVSPRSSGNRGRLGQRHGLIIKGKRRSCLSQYGHRDRTRGRLRQRHGSEHGFPLIRSLRASAQRSTSVLFSFVLSLIVAASFTLRQSKTSYGFQITYIQNTYTRQPVPTHSNSSAIL